MRPIIFALPAVLALVSALVGCDTTKAPHAGRNDPVVHENLPRISVENKQLADDLAFSPPSVQSGPEQPMSVLVQVRYLEDEKVHVQYRFEFYDRNGRPVGNPMSWRYLRIPPRTPVNMEGAALDTNAVDWKLIVRSSRSDY